MAWDGGGNFSRVHNWVNDAAADIDITASRVDAEDDNLATGIGACLTKNGETKPTANFSPTTTRTYDLGTTSLRWRTAYIGTGFNIQSATAAAATTFSFTDATSARTITFPDATGTVSLLGVDETISGIKTFTAANTHSGAEIFSTIVLSSTISSTKAAESGYTRISPNYCRKTTLGADTALVRDTVTQVDGPAGCTAIVLNLRPEARTNNALGLRSATIIVYSDSGGTNALASAFAQGREDPVVGAGNIAVAFSAEYVCYGSTVYVKLQDDSGNQGTGFYQIVGYYD